MFLDKGKAGHDEKKPNIIYILADDMGYGDVKCNNPDSKIPTPNLDRLSEQGIRFTDANAGSSICTPSRYSAVGGSARIYAETGEPAGPGVMAYSGFSTRRRVFQANLSGNSLFEITLVDYNHEGAFLNKHLASDGTDAEEEDPLVGRYCMGFCLAIGSYQGLVGCERDQETDRVVQIHCDWWTSGLSFILCRNVLQEDKEKYPIWGSPHDLAEMAETKSITCPAVTVPGDAILLAYRHNPLSNGTPYEHRWSLGLTNSGNTLYWTLDGIIVDQVEIPGFFDSSPGCVAEGAYATIMAGGSYKRNTWTITDAVICHN